MRNCCTIPTLRPAVRDRQFATRARAVVGRRPNKGGIDIYFEGDSITRRWGRDDYPKYLVNWNTNFFGWNAADFGWGADQIQNILWRLENGNWTA